MRYGSRMVPFNDGLSQSQALALIAETTSARNLLGYGIRALRQSEFLETTIDPVMTMLSIGVEKLQKMTWPHPRCRAPAVAGTQSITLPSTRSGWHSINSRITGGMTSP